MGVSQQQLLKWKKEYGTIYQGGTEEYFYCFRPLTVNEYLVLAVDAEQFDEADALEAEDLIVETCLLYPSLDEYGSWPAGLAASLVEAIITSSGWGDEEDMVNRFSRYQEELQSFLTQFKIVIMAAEMGYSWDELDDMSVDRIVELVASANEILVVKASIAAGSPIQVDLTGEDPAAPMGVDQSQDDVARKLHEASRRAGIA